MKKTILKKVDFHIEREDKVAFVGKNGEGKSTMVRMIMGESATEGKVGPGFSTTVGYFAQDDADNLDGNKTVFETIDELAIGDVRKQVRGILGSFLFSGDSIDKKVKVLSGGERTRLALCRLLLRPNNLLILDEPTNHLDLRSKDVLKKALLNFDGTVIVVSHDRDFLSGLTNKTFEFKNGNVKQYIGDVNEFLEARKAEDFRAIEKEKGSTQTAKKTEEKTEPSDTRDKESRTLKSQLNTVEKKISELEKKIADYDALLNDPNRYNELINDKAKYAQYEKLKVDLDAEMKRWEEIQGQLDAL